MLVDMTWLLMDIKTWVVKLGVRDLTIVVLIRSKTKMKVNIVFSMKTEHKP